jgi:hypothetical protein
MSYVVDVDMMNLICFLHVRACLGEVCWTSSRMV